MSSPARTVSDIDVPAKERLAPLVHPGGCPSDGAGAEDIEVTSSPLVVTTNVKTVGDGVTVRIAV